MKGEKETSWGVTFEPKVQQTMNGFSRRTKYCCNIQYLCKQCCFSRHPVRPTDVELHSYYLQLQMQMYMYLYLYLQYCSIAALFISMRRVATCVNVWV